MTKFTVTAGPMAGFAAESAHGGALFLIQVKCPFITSEDPVFHVWMKAITADFLSKSPVPLPLIHKFLVVLHSDNTADVYVNDFAELAKVQVKEAVQAGAPVFADNITDIAELTFPEIEIKRDDAIVYCVRSEWRFHLFYDFTRDVDLRKLSEELGALKKESVFRSLVTATDAAIALASSLGAGPSLFVITEGKSDWKHLKAARGARQIQQRIEFIEDNQDRGSDTLLKMCGHYAVLPHPKPIVFVFDRDEKPIIDKLGERDPDVRGYQSWGNNVYSLCLPLPAHRNEQNDAVSIELLYLDQDLKKVTREGRRLFFSSEFDKRSGRHVTEDLNCTVLNKISRPLTCVIDSQVFTRDGTSVALSKDDFAELVLTRQEPFANMDFSSFQPVFDLLAEIQRDNV